MGFYSSAAMSKLTQRKTRHMRGHVSHGHCRVGRHRKHPGGRGNAGGMHHERIMMEKYHPGYYGKRGMKHYHKNKNRFYTKVVNLDKLWTLVSEDARKASTSSKAAVIDVTKAGYIKVLGKGELPKTPCVVRAKEFSKIACKRIAAVGGACQLIASIDYLYKRLTSVGRVCPLS